MGQGKENAKKYLAENPETCEEIESKIRQKLLESQQAEANTEVAQAMKSADDEVEVEDE